MSDTIIKVENLSKSYLIRYPADVLATWADIGRAEQLLGWWPQSSFENGVAHLVDWYQTHHHWAKDIIT